MANTASTLVIKYLTGDYPADRDRLVERAEQQGADATVLTLIRNLPDERYASASAVKTALESAG
jgi:hypothetical protein